MVKSPIPSRADEQGRIKQAGTTVVEMVIVTVLTAMILSMFYGSASSVSTVTARNNREVKNRAKQSDVLNHIRSELEQSGNDNRYTITAGGKSIVYTKLVGALRNGVSVSGLWSQTYSIERSAEGEVMRKEGSKIVSWGVGVLDLTFAQNINDRYISVTCVTRQKNRNVARTIHVYPRN